MSMRIFRQIMIAKLSPTPKTRIYGESGTNKQANEQQTIMMTMTQAALQEKNDLLFAFSL